MKKSLCTLVLLLASCTTVEFVRKDLTPEKKAVLRYSPPSSEKRAADDRAELDKQARKFCGSDFKITKEYEAREQSGSTGIGTGVTTGVGFGVGGVMIGNSVPTTEMYHFVDITCQ